EWGDPAFLCAHDLGTKKPASNGGPSSPKALFLLINLVAMGGIEPIMRVWTMEYAEIHKSASSLDHADSYDQNLRRMLLKLKINSAKHKFFAEEAEFLRYQMLCRSEWIYVENSCHGYCMPNDPDTKLHPWLSLFVLRLPRTRILRVFWTPSLWRRRGSFLCACRCRSWLQRWRPKMPSSWPSFAGRHSWLLAAGETQG